MNEKFPIQKEFGEVKQKGETLEVKKFGTDEVVCKADFYKFDEPIHYQLNDLTVPEKEDRGKGFASQLFAEAERISREKNIPIVLYDGMMLHMNDQNSYAIGMYGRRDGWTRLRERDGKTTGYYVYGSRDPQFFQHVLDFYDPTKKKSLR